MVKPASPGACCEGPSGYLGVSGAFCVRYRQIDRPCRSRLLLIHVDVGGFLTKPMCSSENELRFISQICSSVFLAYSNYRDEADKILAEQEIASSSPATRLASSDS